MRIEQGLACCDDLGSAAGAALLAGGPDSAAGAAANLSGLGTSVLAVLVSDVATDEFSDGIGGASCAEESVLVGGWGG